jgi:hypothetical protein
MQKFIVEKKCPDGVHQFPTTVRQDVSLLGRPFCVELRNFILDRVWQLKIRVIYLRSSELQ